jgi:hypothetical protein
MEIQNLLVGALTYLVKFQSTQCQTARERALMMFEVLADHQDTNPQIETLCTDASNLLLT